MRAPARAQPKFSQTPHVTSAPGAPPPGSPRAGLSRTRAPARVAAIQADPKRDQCPRRATTRMATRRPVTNARSCTGATGLNPSPETGYALGGYGLGASVRQPYYSLAAHRPVKYCAL